jgi:hypothetical protein
MFREPVGCLRSHSETNRIADLQSRGVHYLMTIIPHPPLWLLANGGVVTR